MPRAIALMNQKGGVGKTTTAVSLGAAIAKAGRRVCLIDLDPQANLTLHLGIDPREAESTVYDLLLDPQCPAQQVVRQARPNLDVIPAEVDLAAAETELADRSDRQRILLEKFASIANRYDTVLFDCPPSLGLLTLNALAAAREVFVPMQAHFLALQGVGKLLETVARVCRSVNPHLRVTGIVLCMHEAQTTLAREVVADLDAFFDRARDQDVPWRSCRVLRPAIRRNIKLAEAPSFGKTIFDYSPWCAGALDYRRLAEHLLDSWDRADEGPAPQRSAQSPPAPKQEPPVIETKPSAQPLVPSASAPGDQPDRSDESPRHSRQEP
ncbi:MAG: ParA family protein [Planctomycetota bacterium]